MRETYPGTSGSTHGDRKEIRPAKKAAMGSGRLDIDSYCTCRAAFAGCCLSYKTYGASLSYKMVCASIQCAFAGCSEAGGVPGEAIWGCAPSSLRKMPVGSVAWSSARLPSWRTCKLSKNAFTSASLPVDPADASADWNI